MPAVFQDTVALVTGAASGIGLALAEVLLDQGASMVMLADLRAEALALETARLQAAAPGRVIGRPCDVTDAGAVEAAVAGIVAQAGRLDLLINNAGAAFPGAFDRLTEAIGPAASRSTSTAPGMASRRRCRSCAGRGTAISSTSSPASPSRRWPIRASTRRPRRR